MVFMAEKEENGENNGKNLSQIEREKVELEDIPNNVFDIESEEKKKSRYSFPFANKMMTMEGDFESFQRPRSFSDASVSSGRHGKVVNDVLHTDGRTSMKVFVRRESHVISKDKGQTKSAEADDLQTRRHDFDLGSKPAENILSLGNIENKIGVSEGAPPKPKLPSNYRKYLNEQLKLYHETNDKCKNSGGNTLPEESHAKSNYMQGINKSDKLKDSKQTEQSKSKVRSFDSGKNPPAGNLRRGRSSVSELSSKPVNVIYRHFDPEIQSQLLKKELDTLRISRNVRKKSETMKQWIEGGSRPKSTGDLHVRFSDEITVKELKDLDKAIEKYGANKTLPRQSKSVDIPRKDSKTIENSGQRKSALAFPQSGATGSRTKAHIGEIVGDKRVGDEVKTFRSRDQALKRGQAPIRSKSATALGRRREVSREPGDPRPLEDSKNSQLSKSASNLRRKLNTITKFNYSSVEQMRENVRARYQQSDRKNRPDSFSPEMDDVDKRVSADFKAGGQQKFDLRVGANTSDLKDMKTIGDNRSDEEKYAALSRSKIVHSKSSSLDSQLDQNPAGRAKNNTAELRHDNNQYKNYAVNKHGPDHLAERMKLTFNLDKIAQRSSKTGAQYVNVPKYKDSRTTRDEADLAYSDSEYIVNKGAKLSHSVPNLLSNTSQQGKIVLRQCRIGADVVFGLVAVQDGANSQTTPASAAAATTTTITKVRIKK